MHWQVRINRNGPLGSQSISLSVSCMWLLQSQKDRYTPCFFCVFFLVGWGLRRARIKRNLACITAVWPPAAEWSLSMMKHQTHSRTLITNGLTGNDDDNARVCTLSSIAISLLLTFMARAGKYTSVNPPLARPQTFHELSKTSELCIPGRAKRERVRHPSGSEGIALFSCSCLSFSISCFLSGPDFPSQCQASISSLLLCCSWTEARLCFRHGETRTWKQTLSLVYQRIQEGWQQWQRAGALLIWIQWPSTSFFSLTAIRQVIKRQSEWHQSMTNRLPSRRAHCLPTK